MKGSSLLVSKIDFYELSINNSNESGKHVLGFEYLVIETEVYNLRVYESGNLFLIFSEISQSDFENEVFNNL